MDPDPHDEPRDVDERVGFADLLRPPFDSVPAWWGPFVDDSDQQQLGAVEINRTKHVLDFGEDMLEFAKTVPRRRFLVCNTLRVSDFAGVYIAIDVTADRPVVLKISRHAIDREGRLSATASHPNVITVYDTFVCQGYPTMVLEWCRQGTLSTQARLCSDWKDVLVRGIEAGRGLAHCHSLGTVHGDVKPTNILIVDDVAKLADFGIARSETQDGDLVASWLFAAPERQRGVWTAAGDVYSYAATLLSALENFRVPAEVRKILKAAKTKAPERRPTMLQLLADLERVLDPEPIASEPARSPSRGWVWAQVALVVACTAIVTSTVIEGMCSPPDEKPKTSTERAIEVTLEQAAESVAEGNGAAAVNYLEAALSRARRAFDKPGMVIVAEQAEVLGHVLLERGDDVHANESWAVAHDAFLDLGDRSSAERVDRLLVGD